MPPPCALRRRTTACWKYHSKSNPQESCACDSLYVAFVLPPKLSAIQNLSQLSFTGYSLSTGNVIEAPFQPITVTITDSDSTSRM